MQKESIIFSWLLLWLQWEFRGTVWVPSPRGACMVTTRHNKNELSACVLEQRLTQGCATAQPLCLEVTCHILEELLWDLALPSRQSHLSQHPRGGRERWGLPASQNSWGTAGLQSLEPVSEILHATGDGYLLQSRIHQAWRERAADRENGAYYLNPTLKNVFLNKISLAESLLCTQSRGQISQRVQQRLQDTA